MWNWLKRLKITPAAAEALLGLVALLVAALGLAALTTGLRSPGEPEGQALMVLGTMVLVAVCYACDASGKRA